MRRRTESPINLSVLVAPRCATASEWPELSSRPSVPHALRRHLRSKAIALQLSTGDPLQFSPNRPGRVHSKRHDSSRSTRNSTPSTQKGLQRYGESQNLERCSSIPRCIRRSSRGRRPTSRVSLGRWPRRGERPLVGARTRSSGRHDRAAAGNHLDSPRRCSMLMTSPN